MSRQGVLLVAFGCADCLDAVEPFMCSLMGREAPAAAVDAAKRRYLAIGGSSPLPAIAEALASQLERELSGLPRGEDVDDDEDEGLGLSTPKSHRLPDAKVRIPVEVGMRHSEPSIERAIARLATRGVTDLVWVSLSPFDAEATIGSYRREVERAAAARGIERVSEAGSYHHSDPFVAAHAEALNEQLHGIDILQNRVIVVFTAHSLPVADIEADPTYVAQLQETAAAVAAGTGLGDPSGFEALPGIEAYGGPGVTAPWLLAFQSKGRSGEWLGPDLDEVIDSAAVNGYAAVIVCPIGFATDHLETLYDIDVMAADRTLLADMEFARSTVPNDGPHMVAALAGAVRPLLT